jgi:hypothetical protein
LQEISAQMRAQRNAESNGRARTDMMVDFKATASTAFGFSHSIQEHNLQKEDGSLYNFNNPADIATLEPEVGQEIEDLINKLNNGEDMAPFVLPANSQSSDHKDQSKNLMPVN